MSSKVVCASRWLRHGSVGFALETERLAASSMLLKVTLEQLRRSCR
jgi:hypothetical protein